MMICVFCAKKLPHNVSYCPYCGKQIRSTIEQGRCCSNCGAKLIRGAAFCSVCGLKINQDPFGPLEDFLQLTIRDVAPNTQRRGNLVGNSGLIAEEDNFLYFNRQSDNGKLYKLDLQTAEITKLSDDGAHNISVLDGWVYYNAFDLHTNRPLGIYRIQTDGSCRTKLCDFNGLYMNVFDTWIYFCSLFNMGDYNSGMYRMRNDGSEKYQVTDSTCHNLNVVGDTAYFCSYLSSSGSSALYRMDIGLPGQVKIAQDSFQFICADREWIYYLTMSKSKNSNTGVYKMRTDGTDKQLLINENASKLVVSGGRIFFSGATGISSIQADGTGLVRLTEDPILGFSVIRNWIYYRSLRDPRHVTVYRVRTDGTDCRPMPLM